MQMPRVRKINHLWRESEDLNKPCCRYLVSVEQKVIAGYLKPIFKKMEAEEKMTNIPD